MEEKQEHIEDPALAGDIDGVKDVIFKVVFNKKKHDVSFPLDATIAQLKDHLHTIIGKMSVLFIYIYWGKYLMKKWKFKVYQKKCRKSWSKGLPMIKNL